ncbi:Eukaryotic rRNA processing [Penicillium fimorum]|uniref:Eukaryotic rRNA processing n=1 Tax=Penicillium fimorum TaxID=1882269 RepID=A0A9W9XPF2_9EURO|nr:Eukaryotic rRNA processing [Penicillium fimorum]
MGKRSKLLQALDAHKGRDFEAEKQKKMIKTAEKKKAKKTAAAPEDKVVEEEKKEEEEVASSDAEEEEEEEVDQDEEMEDEEEEEEDIPLSDLDEDEREDVVPHQRLTINNSAAILSALKRISFIGPQTPFSEHNSLVSKEPIEIEDANDDLNRELAFYKVCQVAATQARGLLKKDGIPFTRPGDYFAEMVKNDEHMALIKKKLYEEAAGKKASAEARRQRDLKKFGKQVQNSKLQQRHKEKREMLEKINALKKKRKADGSAPTDDANDMFDIAIEEATQPDKKRSRGDGPGNNKRQKKDAKFGFGGKKRHAKSGDAASSGDLSNFSAKKMKGGAKRPGKSKRVQAKGRN